MSRNLIADPDWVPAACTLPTVEQPLRREEFDSLFSQDVINVAQESAHELRLELRPDPDTASRAASLAALETGCCSFFTFQMSITEGRISLTISAGPAHEPVLAALRARAESKIGPSA